MMFSVSPDDVVRDAMNLHFGIITGVIEPQPKKHGLPEEEKAKWRHELSFINFMAFRNAFTVAVSRGLCSPAEIAAGNEILAMMDA
jgi:hypothetical protein